MGERLSDDEIAYHQTALNDLRSAQAAWQSWAGHLHRKYALQPGDEITADGLVLRSAANDEEAGAAEVLDPKQLRA